MDSLRITNRAMQALQWAAGGRPSWLARGYCCGLALWMLVGIWNEPWEFEPILVVRLLAGAALLATAVGVRSLRSVSLLCSFALACCILMQLALDAVWLSLLMPENMPRKVVESEYIHAAQGLGFFGVTLMGTLYLFWHFYVED